MMDVNMLRSAFIRQAAAAHGSSEAAAMFREVYLHFSGIDYQNPLRNDPVSDALAQSVLHIARELEKGIPLQYALGYTYFHGERFEVDSDVLIPRPETEELLDWIIEDYAENPPVTILDIGTGSGCLAICLAQAFPNAEILALDASEQALNKARSNALRILGSEHNIHWQLLDYLSDFPDKSFELIVSNPPYILLKDKHIVDQHVWTHEPSMALFVSGDDPLLFYRRMAQNLLLQHSGTIYAELHSGQANAAEAMFRANISGVEITLKADFNGVMRMIRCIKKGN